MSRSGLEEGVVPTGNASNSDRIEATARLRAAALGTVAIRFTLARCRSASTLAKKKNIDLRIEIDSTLKDVALDQQKFKQVMLNLLSNAVKFTDDGGRIDVIADPYKSDRLRLQVRDTGIGIKAEDFGKLFVEFQQIDSGTSRRYEGTGLGLALTKKIVEFQKGTITVESSPGTGSTFTVILPMSSSQSADNDRVF